MSCFCIFLISLSKIFLTKTFFCLFVSNSCMIIIRKSEAMNRPKKQFIPTTLSDLNIDSLSIGSNNDRQNNNSNGARLNNFDRFKATSSSNLSYKHSNINNNNNNSVNNNNSKNFSRTSKMYGSQSNISTTSSGSRYQSVNNSNNNNNNGHYYNINSPKTSATGGDTDKWLQAWEDNNNNYRAPSFHPNKQTPSFEKVNLSKQISRTSSNYSRSNSINNRNSNHRHSNQSADPFDPFEDPWSGTLLFFSFLFYLCTQFAQKNSLLYILFHLFSFSFFILSCTSSSSILWPSIHRRNKFLYFVVVDLHTFVPTNTRIW